MSQIEKISGVKVFGGWQNQYQHESSSLNCSMKFSVYLPPAYEQQQPVGVLYWLSGLTCTDENFVTKAGAQRIASELGIILVIPDTSPRGDEVPNDDAYDLGQGAGFYLNATQPPWDKHYHMYDYIVNELPSLIKTNFNVRDKAAIAGHSMGGHGALVIGLANQMHYTSVSAFAPIVNPCECDWGKKAFSHYLGDDQSAWQQYDACHLMQQQQGILTIPMLVDQGLADNFYESQKLTKPLEEMCKQVGYPAQFAYHEGYDHSYFFISSFIEQHLRFHHRYLTA
ncbi:S-formylglutathione hydrolase [Neptunicella marina]|uniref:S-formylglutathione hydrolase n=1 Tax=Neptunicella marina TaxID=2125989 RepID=A0A8J6M0V3_9ALTE|nr:S-formylglutathione hydrolase [Neptunicella marina]